MLHMQNPLGGANEFVVCTYNLLTLGQYIQENIELRKEVVELVNTYLKKIATAGNVKPGNLDPSNPNYMFMILSQRLDENDKKFDKLEELIKKKVGGGW